SKNAVQAVGSTVSYLQRYTLLAGTGMAAADQDDDGRGGPQVTISDEQIANIKKLAEESGTSMSGILQWMNIQSLDKLPIGRYQTVASHLENNRAKYQAKKNGGAA